MNEEQAYELSEIVINYLKKINCPVKDALNVIICIYTSFCARIGVPPDNFNKNMDALKIIYKNSLED